MNKDELIQIHVFLRQLRIHLEDMTGCNDSQVFSSYDSLSVGPYQIQKSKDEHRLAVFELCKGIAALLKQNDPSIFKKIYNSLDNVCNSIKK